MFRGYGLLPVTTVASRPLSPPIGSTGFHFTRVGGARTRQITMRILVACEFSGIVREAFRARGHDAKSVDLLPSEQPSDHHHQGNVFDVLDNLRVIAGWQPDLMIAHPPCTHLSVSGARWFLAKAHFGLQLAALDFVRDLMDCGVPKIAIENPVSVISTAIRKPDQTIAPNDFGHGETKATCLWLKNLPLLKPTHIVEGRKPRVHYESPGPDRWKNRSRTLTGIAEAMADQWGNL
jgi:hypothetical protein